MKIIYEAIFRLSPGNVVAAELLRSLILTAGVDPERVVEEERKGELTLSAYFERRPEASQVLADVRRMKITGFTSTLKRHREQDWSTRWKEGWKPFGLTRRFQVVPLWQESRKCPRGKEPLFLDTTSAFGTGLHETTRFSAQLIDELNGKFSSFMDVGTGSGILAIVAWKLGAKKVIAFDIDPEAVKVARKNLRANRLSMAGVITADVARYRVRHACDLVVANLVTQDLISFRDRILPLVKPGGHLIVSGISVKNFYFFRNKFCSPMIKKISMKKGKEWVAVLFKKEG